MERLETGELMVASHATSIHPQAPLGIIAVVERIQTQRYAPWSATQVGAGAYATSYLLGIMMESSMMVRRRRLGGCRRGAARLLILSVVPVALGRTLHITALHGWLWHRGDSTWCDMEPHSKPSIIGRHTNARSQPSTFLLPPRTMQMHAPLRLGVLGLLFGPLVLLFAFAVLFAVTSRKSFWKRLFQVGPLRLWRRGRIPTPWLRAPASLLCSGHHLALLHGRAQCQLACAQCKVSGVFLIQRRGRRSSGR